MDKHVSRIYILFLAIAFVITVVYAVTGTERRHKSMFPEDTAVIVTPVDESTEPEFVYCADLDASEILDAGGCLCFITSFRDIWVYADGELIYENLGSRSRLMRTNGNNWNFIKVPESANLITLKTKPVYEGDEDIISPEFIAGDYYNLRSQLVVKSTLILFISILDVLFGIAMFIYSLATRRVNPGRIKTTLIGLTALLIGIWSSGETDASVILIQDRALAGAMAFFTLVFIPLPYVMYIHEVLWKKDKFWYKIPVCLSLLDFVIVTGLALSGIMDLKKSVIITHLIWGVSILYVVTAAIRTLRHKEDRDDLAVFNAASMLVLIAVTLVDMAYYWTGARIQNDVVGRFLILAYLGLLAYKNVAQSIKDIEKGRMAEYYRQLANTDSLTGLANRTAFNQDVDNLGQDKGYSIVSMDLNNLKEVNDTLGHQAGDQYIMDAAGIINSVFGEKGICYRIGGDEFCVILKEERSEETLSELISRMEESINSHNQDSPTRPVSIAWGYAINDPMSPRDYLEVLRSADEKMYENKRFQKGVAPRS